jgi:hypothetical protein
MAADLNSLQDAINRMINATYSHKAVVVDGSGGAIVTPLAGTTLVSANLLEATVPGTSRTRGTDCIGTRPWGMAVITGSGTFKKGFNCKSASRTGVGQYQFEFYGLPSDPTWTNCTGSASSPGTALSLTFQTAAFAGNLLVSVDVRDGANALTDALVNMLVYAE